MSRIVPAPVRSPKPPHPSRQQPPDYEEREPPQPPAHKSSEIEATPQQKFETASLPGIFLFLGIFLFPGFVGVYGPNEVDGRVNLWRSLRTSLDSSYRWALMGDFNMIEDGADQWGGTGGPISGRSGGPGPI